MEFRCRDREPREYAAQAADEGAISCPAYRRDAVVSGPFRVEPFEIRSILCQRPDGQWRERHEIETCATAWLVGALDAHGVQLGNHDHLVAALIAHDSWTNVQVVSGWIAQAASNGPRDVSPGRGGPQSGTDDLPGL